MSAGDVVGTIRIGKRETSVDLEGIPSEKVSYLRIYSGNKQANLELLASYPQVTQLFLQGEFANLDGISCLKGLRSLTMYPSAPVDFSGVRGLPLVNLTVGRSFHESLAALLTENLESLELTAMRKLRDLSFVERASGLKKLSLSSLPAVECLPDFGKMPDLYALKVYELHQLNDLESLTRSAIRYLALALAADKLTGSKIAEVLLRMECLEHVDVANLDRSGFRRYGVLEKRMRQAGKGQILEESEKMRHWALL